MDTREFLVGAAALSAAFSARRHADAVLRLTEYIRRMFWLDDGSETELEELLEHGPVLLLFYLFDWSPT